MLGISNSYPQGPMTAHALRTAKIVTFIISGAAAAVSAIAGRYFWLLLIFVAASTVLVLLRRRVTEVLADERDRGVAGQAALAAMYGFCWMAACVALAAFALRDANQYNETIALTLAYSACVIMVAYGLIYRYYDRLVLLKRKGLFVTLGLIIMVVVAVGGLRLLSPEDDWVCDNGEWVQHGHPEIPMPSTPCKK